MLSKEDIAEKIKEDKLIQASYKRTWTQLLTASIVLAIIFPLVLYLERDTYLFTISVLWGIPFAFAATGSIIYFGIGTKRDYEGRGRGQILKKILTYILGFVPLYSEIVFRTSLSPVTALWVTPLTLFVASFLAVRGGGVEAPGARPLTDTEYAHIKTIMSQGGVDAGKAGLAFITPDMYQTVKSYTPSDWNHIATMMRSGGVDIFKDK